MTMAALSPGERVDRDGAFFSRRGPGEGLLPLAIRLILPKICIGPYSRRARSELTKRPLTRRAPADENAGVRHPLPKGEGSLKGGVSG